MVERHDHEESISTPRKGRTIAEEGRHWVGTPTQIIYMGAIYIDYLYRSSLEDIVSEHTDVSCCPGRMGTWLEKPDLAGCVNVVDEYGPWQGPFTGLRGLGLT